MDLVILCKSEAKASSSCYYLVEVTFNQETILSSESEAKASVTFLI